VPASHDHTYLYVEQRAGTALVFLDRPAGHLDADSVASDNLGGSVEAVEHLLAHGHRRIAFLGDLLSISTAEERLQGYSQALEQAGIATGDELVRTGLRDPEAGTAAVEALLALPDPPTALFTSQNLLTIGGIRALRSAGFERRVALIGFDERRARRRPRPGCLGRRTGSAGARPVGGRPSVPTTGRRHVTVGASRRPGEADRPRVGRDPTR